MVFDPQWLLLGIPLTFALGWLASRLDLRQWRREQKDSPKAYYKGLNLLLNDPPRHQARYLRRTRRRSIVGHFLS